MTETNLALMFLFPGVGMIVDEMKLCDQNIYMADGKRVTLLKRRRKVSMDDEQREPTKKSFLNPNILLSQKKQEKKTKLKLALQEKDNSPRKTQTLAYKNKLQGSL